MESKKVHGLGLGVLLALFVSLSMLLPTTAGAELVVTSVNAEIENSSGDPETRAGVHPFKVINEFTVAAEEGNPFSPSGSFKDVIVETPVGFVGDPTDFPTCAEDDLYNGACPVESQIGTLGIGGVGQAPNVFGLYNMEPGPGQAALFGSYPLAIVPIYLEATVRPEDNGITITVRNVPTAFPVGVSRVEMWGVPASSAFDNERGWWPDLFPPTPSQMPEMPFLTNPTSCDDEAPVTRMRINEWANPEGWVEREFEHPQFTDCEDLDYRGEFSVTPASSDAGAPSGYTVELEQQLNDSADGFATSHLRRAELTLPEGVRINPAAGIGLSGCTPAQIGLGTGSEVRCPQSSRIGSVMIETPLLKDTMRGAIYQAAPYDNPFGSLLGIYLVPEDKLRGVTLKLPGKIELDPATGQIKSTFDNNPQLPFSKLTLRFNGGERAILTNPKTCGSHTANGSLAPWSGNAPSPAPASFRISGNCDAGTGFDPQLIAGTESSAAGSTSPFSLIVRNGAGGQDLTGIRASLPEGLLGYVGKVPLCESAAADRGSCPEAAKIGRVQVGVGAGSTSLWVPEAGKADTAVYLAGPYRGAPYSLSIVVPAQAGPLDLGTVVSRAPLHVDPNTTQISTEVTESRVYGTDGSLAQVVNSGLPTHLQGIPLEIREIRVLMDRDEFMVNPTNCSAQQVAATLGSAAGASLARSVHFQASDCANLGFAPRFRAQILNKGRKSTLRSFHPRTRFAVVPRKGDANIGAARVVLPSSTLLDQANIGTTCTRADMAANDCPEASIVGHARAWSPLLQRPVQGPVYLAANGGVRPLPDLAAVMDGEIRVRLMGEISTLRRGRTARLQNTFRVVPDAPVSRFVLTMRGGAKRGLLVNSTDLCRTNERGVAVFRGQNGRTHRLRPRIATAFRGCVRVRRQAARRSMARKAMARQAAVRRAVATARRAMR